jgi:hypothetical protein
MTRNVLKLSHTKTRKIAREPTHTGMSDRVLILVEIDKQALVLAIIVLLAVHSFSYWLMGIRTLVLLHR